MIYQYKEPKIIIMLSTIVIERLVENAFFTINCPFFVTGVLPLGLKHYYVCVCVLGGGLGTSYSQRVACYLKYIILTYNTSTSILKYLTSSLQIS